MNSCVLATALGRCRMYSADQHVAAVCETSCCMLWRIQTCQTCHLSITYLGARLSDDKGCLYLNMIQFNWILRVGPVGPYFY